MTDRQTEKRDLLGMLPEELQTELAKYGEPSFRAKQIFSQLHRGVRPDEMTNIGAAAKEALASFSRYYLPQPEQKLVSAIDGTVKYLFRLHDGNCVESVVMKYEHGLTICISSQVGCRMGCKFCASTIGGRVRDLDTGELVGQIVAAQKDLGVRIAGIVMMGIGEPLDNYDNVVRFLRLVNHPDGLNIGYRHISLSTCGLVDRIYDLMKLDLPITLSISLHAADDETRSSIMPVNKRYPIDTLLDACASYFAHTGRRISFEYTLIAGKNDSPKAAVALADLLNRKLRPERRGPEGGAVPIHVNLIPVNEVSETGFTHSEKAAVRRFAEILEQHGIRATVRRRLGSDINASCGQLRRQALGASGQGGDAL
ncbi:MAG: 23S rRNA (adenine(2503)-C(2))-methyltransferase RlmN [Clostridia bacterium]|nr:23S rRNA (adenine(2503)-C(2))-methyltransferase RlmN [Clostridia bacterium]